MVDIVSLEMLVIIQYAIQEKQEIFMFMEDIVEVKV